MSLIHNAADLNTKYTEIKLKRSYRRDAKSAEEKLKKSVVAGMGKRDELNKIESSRLILNQWEHRLPVSYIM